MFSKMRKLYLVFRIGCQKFENDHSFHKINTFSICIQSTVSKALQDQEKYIALISFACSTQDGLLRFVTIRHQLNFDND